MKLEVTVSDLKNLMLSIFMEDGKYLKLFYFFKRKLSKF